MEHKRKNFALRCALAGACAGALNGFFGGGGGMLLVPMLCSFCGIEEKKSFATCVCIILPVCAVSAAIYFLRGGIELSAAMPYLIGGLAGGVISGKIFKKIPSGVLRRIFALFIIWGGVKYLLWK